LAVVDISRGGIGLRQGPRLAAGLQTEIEIPGIPQPLPCRVARSNDVLLGLIFRQDSGSLALIETATKIAEARTELTAA
jgi:hypothetical protein